MSAVSSGRSAAIGQRPASPSAATDTIVGRRSWTGARRTASIIFGLTGTKTLATKIDEFADAICVARAIEDKDAVRGFAETTHAAKSWTQKRRVAARIEATRLGLDIRYVVTNITSGTTEWLYADLYCARGQAENLIKLHKAQLASDRTSCRAACNQFLSPAHRRLLVVLAVRDAIPKAHALAKAEFTTIRLRLLKVAARVTETASRVRIAFASAYPTPSSSATWRGRSGRPRPEPGGVKPLPTRSLPSNALHTFSIRRGEKHAAHHRDRLLPTTIRRG